jgi:hypothetical protein
MRTKSSVDSAELDPDRQPALQLGDQVGRLGEVKGAEAMNRMWSVLHHAVLGGHRAALDQRQQVALHALARDVGTLVLAALGDLVELVEKDDAVLLDVLERAQLQVLPR